MSSPLSTFVVVCLVSAMAAILVPDVMAMPIDYAVQRVAFIQLEQAMQTGGGCGFSLNSDEQIVDNILKNEKRQLVEAARVNGSDFAARYNFLNLTARAAMEATTGFQIIQKMPKGGILHIHDEAITSIDWLVRNVTYRDNCYMCVDKNFIVTFHFYQTPPKDQDCVWRLVSAFRKESGNPSEFDKTLHNNLTMVVEHPEVAYPDITAVWARFSRYFSQVTGLMLYAPVFKDYLWEGLRQLREDNVQYLEIRGLLPEVYELDGTVHDKDWVLGAYRQGVAQFVQQYPDFTGARFIKTSLRYKESSEILSEVKDAMRLYTQHSDFVVGFDLVGQEDPLHPLVYYIDDLLYPSRQDPPVNLPYFFHAGETDWQQTGTDNNLVDALLLNTTRIGHGYAVHKHPLVKEMIRQRDIAIEVNPISNQVLKLVADLRNHPAAALIAENIPIVISSDDPAPWEAAPLSHDFYVTFMTLTGEGTGLATLKQLAINSLRYSALQPAEKQKALSDWQQKWDTFIHEIVNGLGKERDILVG